jgi:hypothetical protein
MAGILERMSTMASTDVGKVVGLAHSTYRERMEVHNHTGRAIIETIVHVAKTHPAFFGIGLALLAEAVMTEEHLRHEHEAERKAAQGTAPATQTSAPGGGLHLPHVSLPHLEAPHLEIPSLHAPQLHLDHIKPGKVALEVFGGLVLLKFAVFGARMFRRKAQHDVWFAPASKVHLISGTLGAYYAAKSLRSPRISAWRNAAAALFISDALKPVLKAPKRRKGTAAARPPVAAAPMVAAAPVVQPTTPPDASPDTPTNTPPNTPVTGPTSGPAPTATPPAGPGTAPSAGPDTSAPQAQLDPGPMAPAVAAAASAAQYWTPPPRPNREMLSSPAHEASATPQHDIAPPIAEAAGLAPRPALPQTFELPSESSPTGEIIQWTGFSGAWDAASRH